MDEPTNDDRREQAPVNESKPEQVGVILRRMFRRWEVARAVGGASQADTQRGLAVPSFLFEWRNMIVSRFGPGSTTRLVLLTLSLRMDRYGGSCRPSVRRLAQETGLNKDTVSKHLTLADKDGWIERRERAVEGRAWRRNEYQATLPQHVQPHRTPCVDVSEQTRHPEARGVRNDTVDVSEQPVQRTYIEDLTTLGASEGNPPPPPRDAYPPTFERFWAAYPRHMSKRAAHRKWEATLRKGATPQELVEAAGRYARYCEAMKTEARFIKYASTFLGPDEHWREDWTVPSENGPSLEQRYESGRKVLEALEARP